MGSSLGLPFAPSPALSLSPRHHANRRQLSAAHPSTTIMHLLCFWNGTSLQCLLRGYCGVAVASPSPSPMAVTHHQATACSWCTLGCPSGATFKESEGEAESANLRDRRASPAWRRLLNICRSSTRSLASPATPLFVADSGSTSYVGLVRGLRS
jgi:hypothetical protein